MGDPSTNVREADRKWADASLDAIRVETAARIASDAGRLAAFDTIPAHGDRFKKAVGNSFNYLRGWACTALTADSNFPLESALFDLVIVDEASQCNLATVLPLAYRAKRLAVVGDPCQLNPIVSISDGLLQEIATQSEFDNDDLRERGIHHKYGSSYSAFEYAARPQTPVVLNEHYRCHPHIARWFNKTFYKDALAILTDVSDASQSDRAIYWYDVDGSAVRPASGSWLNQDGGGANGRTASRRHRIRLQDRWRGDSVHRAGATHRSDRQKAIRSGFPGRLRFCLRNRTPFTGR